MPPCRPIESLSAWRNVCVHARTCPLCVCLRLIKHGERNIYSFRKSSPSVLCTLRGVWISNEFLISSLRLSPHWPRLYFPGTLTVFTFANPNSAGQHENDNRAQKGVEIQQLPRRYTKKSFPICSFTASVFPRAAHCHWNAPSSLTSISITAVCIMTAWLNNPFQIQMWFFKKRRPISKITKKTTQKSVHLPQCSCSALLNRVQSKDFLAFNYQ